MFSYRTRTPSQSLRAFTLIEMAIVLGVSGVLVAGLWKLLSSGSQQLRDQATAAQHQQLITAVQGYLGSTEGQSLITALGANGSRNLALPAATWTSVSACQSDTNMTSIQGFCNYLPVGLYTSSTNPYGQTYQIGIRKDAQAINTPAISYSFMVITTGGDTISENSGGRISSMIGGDGGFVYGSPVCTASTSTGTACGTYGVWTATVSQYALTGSLGHVASRTVHSAQTVTENPWLSRSLMAGDAAATPVFNTMATPLLMGGKNLYMSSATSSTASGGTLYLQNGSIVDTARTTGPAISLAETTNALASMINVSTALTAFGNPLVNLTSANCSNPITHLSCNYSLYATSINADLVNTNGLYAGFYQNTSDARLKYDIKTLDHGLEAVMQLRPVSYKYKKDHRASLGFVAQEVEKVYPILVDTGAKDNLKYMNYDGLIAPLVGAVQELKKDNDALRQEIKELRSHINATSKIAQ